MKRFGLQQWLVVLALVLVVSFTGLFAIRTVRRAIYWHHHKDEPIRPWMSLGYIARSHGVPASVLYQALNLPPKTGGPDRRPIREIAREQHRSVDEVIVILQNAIARERPPHPPPGQPTHPESEPSQGRSP